MTPSIMAVADAGSFEFGPRFWIIVVTAVLAVAVIARGIRNRNLSAQETGSSADEAGRPMGRSSFWDEVEAAKNAAGDDAMDRPAQLLRSLKAMEADDIARFDSRYREERARADRAEVRAAAQLMRGGLGDVEFGHFVDWLISEGKAVFEGALSNPDSLADLGKRKVTSLEAFGYAAKRAYKSRANRPLPGTAETAQHSTDAPDFDVAAARAACPRLAELYA